MRSPTLDEADKELTHATEWRHVGENLSIPEWELVNIESDTTLNNMKARKRAMLKQWLDNDLEASWGKLVQALQGADYGNLATSLHSKYCGRYSMCFLKVCCFKCVHLFSRKF